MIIGAQVFGERESARDVNKVVGQRLWGTAHRAVKVVFPTGANVGPDAAHDDNRSLS